MDGGHQITKARDKISPNGPPPATLRPPIRANPSTRGFAGGRNVAEVERANASVTRPEDRAILFIFQLSAIRSAGGVLAEVQHAHTDSALGLLLYDRSAHLK